MCNTHNVQHSSLNMWVIKETTLSHYSSVFTYLYVFTYKGYQLHPIQTFTYKMHDIFIFNSDTWFILSTQRKAGCYLLSQHNITVYSPPCHNMENVLMQRYRLRSLTWEDIKASLPVFCRVSVRGVADDHTGLSNGSVSDQHTADHAGLQLILPGQPASGRHSGLLVKVIHVRWHDEANIKTSD